jgi:preprotein translocase subunit SecE
MAADKVKDKQRARLKERQRVTMPKGAGNTDKKDKKSALSRGLERSKKEQAARKSSQRSTSAQTERKGGFLEYMRGVRSETKKVVWPTRKELVSYTVVVIIACAFFGLYLWGVDTGFLAIIREVFNISMN